MTLASLQQNATRHRVDEAVEMLSLVADLLDNGVKWTGPMNGLTAALRERASEARTIASTLQSNMKDYNRTHIDVVQTVNADHEEAVKAARREIDV